MKKCAGMYYEKFNSIKSTRHNSIYLCGQPGAGKTHLLIAVANSMIQKRNIDVLYFPYVDGFGDLKDDFSLLEKKLARMKEAEVLFIDDLFKPAREGIRATDWQVEQMYNVINHRYLNHMPVMISSELNPRELLSVDEALGSRILEMAKGYTTVIPKDHNLNHRLEGATW